MTKRILQLVAFILILLIAINYKNILKHFYPIHYEKTVIKYAKQYKLDPYLVYSLIKVESKFNPNAKSNKNALGLMQITPNTGAYIADLLGDKKFSSETLLIPEKNIRYGCFYLSKLSLDFDGNLECILAAYNAGEGNVRKWLKGSEIGKSINVEELPFNETRDYVKKVKQNYKIYTFLYTNQNLWDIFK